jgi:hypothetical protein
MFSVQKKFLNEHNSLQSTITNAAEGNVFKEVVLTHLQVPPLLGRVAMDEILNPPCLHQERDNDSVYGFACCKRLFGSSSARYKLRFQCATCKIISVCYLCARRCHDGNVLDMATPKCYNICTSGHDLSLLPIKGPLTEEEMQLKHISRQRRGSINLDEKTLAMNKRYRTLMIGVVNQNNSKHTGRFKSSREKAKPFKTSSSSGKPVPAVPKQSTHRAAHSENSTLPSKYAGIRHQCCHCGVFNKCCKVLPTIPEINEHTCAQLTSRELFAARKIQLVARKYIADKILARKMAVLRGIRRDAATNNFEKQIMKPIYKKVSSFANMKTVPLSWCGCSSLTDGKYLGSNGSR